MQSQDDPARLLRKGLCGMESLQHEGERRAGERIARPTGLAREAPHRVRLA